MTVGYIALPDSIGYVFFKLWFCCYLSKYLKNLT